MQERAVANHRSFLCESVKQKFFLYDASDVRGRLPPPNHHTADQLIVFDNKLLDIAVDKNRVGGCPDGIAGHIVDATDGYEYRHGSDVVSTYSCLQ